MEFSSLVIQHSSVELTVQCLPKFICFEYWKVSGKIRKCFHLL